eukprot:403355233
MNRKLLFETTKSLLFKQPKFGIITSNKPNKLKKSNQNLNQKLFSFQTLGLSTIRTEGEVFQSIKSEEHQSQTRPKKYDEMGTEESKNENNQQFAQIQPNFIIANQLQQKPRRSLVQKQSHAESEKKTTNHQNQYQQQYKRQNVQSDHQLQSFELLKVETIKSLLSEVSDIRYFLHFDQDIDNVQSLTTYYKKFVQNAKPLPKFEQELKTIATYMIAISAYYQSPQELYQLDFFIRVLNDMKRYVINSQNYDHNFLTVHMKFINDIAIHMPNTHTGEGRVFQPLLYVQDIMQYILAQASENFDKLSLSQIAYLTQNTTIYRNGKIFTPFEKHKLRKDEFLNKVEQYLIKNQSTLKVDKQNALMLLIGLSHHKNSDLPEAWSICEKLLLDALNQEQETQQFTAKSSLLTKNELLDLVKSFSNRKSQNKDLWLAVLKQTSAYFKQSQFDVKDLTNLSYNLYIIKIQSPKLFQIIIDYFLKQGFDEKTLSTLQQVDAINFIHSMFYCHQGLDNEDFFKVVRLYIISNLDQFNKLKLTKLVDVFKFNSKFQSQNLNLKLLMEKELDSKLDQILEDSEEEEFQKLMKQ